MTIGAARNSLRNYTLSGTVYPARDGQLATVTVLRSDGITTKLADVPTDAHGLWSYRHTYGSVATYRVKATSAATTLNAAGSATMDVAVS